MILVPVSGRTALSGVALAYDSLWKVCQWLVLVPDFGCGEIANYFGEVICLLLCCALFIMHGFLFGHLMLMEEEGVSDLG